MFTSIDFNLTATAADNLIEITHIFFQADAPIVMKPMNDAITQIGVSSSIPARIASLVELLLLLLCTALNNGTLNSGNPIYGLIFGR